MFIEFVLPSTTQSAGFILHELYTHLEHWSQRYQIAYRKKLVKYTLRVTFDEDHYYDFFALTWKPESQHHQWLTHYRIRDP